VVMRPTVPALAPFVESFWYFAQRLPNVRERVLPTGEMQLLVNLHEDELRSYDELGRARPVAGSALQGVHGGPVTIDTAQQRAIVGVGFRPGGAFPFFAPPASEVRDGLVPLDALWGRDGAVLRDRLLSAHGPDAVRPDWLLSARRPDTVLSDGVQSASEPGAVRPDHLPHGPDAVLRTLQAVLLERLARPLVPDPAVGYAVAAFERGAGVATVAERLGMTHKRFAGRFTDQIGLTPKRFARVRRFQRLIAAIPAQASVDWARLAADRGYYDQAHLIHEFRAFSGVRPTEYRPRSANERNHVPISPMQAGADRATMGP